MFPEGRALEFLLAGVIALIVVGPKDLPVLMRKLGQFTAKLRGMAAEFRASFDEMARQSELEELRREVEAMRHSQYADVARSAGAAEAHDAMTDIHQSLADVGAELGAPTPPYQPAPPYEPTPPERAPEAPPKPTPRKPRAKKATADAAPARKPRARKTPAEPKA